MPLPTVGNAAPSQLTYNFDSVFATSLFNARKTLTDNISNSNPFFYEAKKAGMYEAADGGSLIQEDLLFALAETDSYDGYDTLPTNPPEGITAAFYEWRQSATVIAYSEKERKQNKHRIVNFIEARIKQGELGAIDFYSKAILQGAGAGSLASPRTSPANGSLAVDPLWSIVRLDPTTSTSVGNINQLTYTWWRNRIKSLTGITTSIAFLLAMDNLFNTCKIGPGGGPTHIIVDQTTFEVWRQAYYRTYFRTTDSMNDYPFPNFLFNGARVVWDENMPNLNAGTLDTTTTEGGTAAFLNNQFMKIRYESETDFIQTEFVKPANQDAKVAHVLWMGNLTANQRRKLGVAYLIPRTLAS